MLPETSAHTPQADPAGTPSQLNLSSYINPAVGGIRGLSTISNPSGSDESLILMWCPDGQSKGTIFRLDPNGSQEFDRVYETKTSLLVEDYLPGETVNYILGAYNEFYLFTDPVIDMDLTVIGIESLLQENIYPSWNSFYAGGIIIIRDNNGEYELQEINGEIDFDDNPLVSVRCFTESPFENESAMYFGGFDPNGHTSTNNAWIYKKIWNTLDTGTNSSQTTSDFMVHDNYPNPFNPSTNIPYTILIENFISITIYDLNGIRIKSLINKYSHAGNHTVKWNGKDEKGIFVSAGVYFYSIEAGNLRQTKKMILLK